MKRWILRSCTCRLKQYQVCVTLYFSVLFCLTAMAQETTSDGAQATSSQVMQNYMAAWNAHDANRAIQTLDLNIIYFNTSAGTTRQGQENVAQIIKGLLALIPDLHWKMIGKPIVLDATVAFEWELSGSASIVSNNTSSPSPRRLIHLRGASFARVEHGRIVYLADYYNSLSMQQQLAR